jgi:aminoglycoside 6'-N-acetyltransferase I
MQILTLTPDNDTAIQQAATLLVEGFAEHWPKSWPDLEAALEEVYEALEPERICRIALDDGGRVLGWIGAINQYDGHAWELHPLVVASEQRGRGIGRALVEDLEAQVRARGGTTIYLGTDDENGMTSLSGVDLYPDLFGHLQRIQNLKGHPYQFYQKLGYAIVGVIPDANGPGKPDILMAKKL